ncbi:hypothetical protein BO83DRAFT_430715 [Aspergillus eucalypticola CBS 122712]|uniref:Xylanolytic transcriptional activator xlnR n=1 Tax=Aspergillus eucalypticola (strain CBS 122712 / IBT 29274) TaxID=1448314 RepID=A0A317UWB2_ASPEC|nr:uncharacterized protein BO83DRAFT_430715 [Aspergillus eucalypticola CBS 122712]PWY64807.1 hypothetical protein BO83DRAFT_430715 [Aspergillus eucalypticola CBS 122712]
MTSPLHTSLDSPRPRNRLRKACDFCHQSKVKCTGDSPCVRCIELDIPCRYEFVIRTAKPKGSRNRKALEKAERLRQEATMSTKHLCFASQGQNSSSSASCNSSTSRATGDGEMNRREMNPGDEILLPLNWYSNWMTLSEGYVAQHPSEAYLQHEVTGLWRPNEEEALQLIPSNSAALPFIADSLSPLYTKVTEPISSETPPLNTSNSASHSCTCVSYLLDSKSRLCSLTLDPVERGRFDLGMQAVNRIWASIRAIMQCESHEHHPQLFFLMSWCIRIACGWFQSQAFLKHQHEGPLLCSQPVLDMRCGEYEIPYQQVHVIHGLMVHMAVQEGTDLLRGLRRILEKEETPLSNLPVSVISLNPVDVTYILAVLAQCEEEMLRILHVGRQLLTTDVDD